MDSDFRGNFHLVFDRMTAEACMELFAYYQVALEPSTINLETPGVNFAATIGFTAPHIKGALTLRIGAGLVALSLPTQIKTKGYQDSMLIDWAGELANQLLGRFKTKIWSHGHDISMSTPVVFKGSGIQLFPQSEDITRTVLFSHGEDRIAVMLQARLAHDFTLGSVDDTRAVGINEGEVTLF